MDSRDSQTKANRLSSQQQGSEALLGPTRRDARSVLHHPYEALSKAHHHHQHNHNHYRHQYLRHERYLHSHSTASNSSGAWTLPPPPHSSASTSVSSLARTAEWLRWLIHSAAVSSLDCVPNDSTRELMLMDLPVNGSFTGSHSHQTRLDKMPGIRYYNQGTEETSRPMAPTSTPSRTSQNSSAKNHSNADTNTNTNGNTSNTNTNSNNTRSSANLSQSTNSPHQQSGSTPYPITPSSWSSQPPTPAPPTSFSRSTVSSATIAAAARNARNRGENDDKSGSSSSPSSGRPNRGSSSSSSSSTGSTVGAGTPTSALLFSTSQEFHHVWSQTTAFLHRTFSPTYRVGHLYWDSWTNGTQRRGLERLKTSVLRGDAFRLMQNTTVQLRNLWHRSVAESRAQAIDLERKARAIDAKRRQIQERALGTSSSSASSASSTASTSTTTPKSDNQSSNITSNSSDGKPRNQ